MYFLSCITLFIFLFPVNPVMGFSRKNTDKDEGVGGGRGNYRAISMVHEISRVIKKIVVN